ncbi:MAG: 3-dehydroquinate synthase [Clostridia bacterium]|nr:3-dehydroquinate synthase [Clostridia bacterium]
MEIKVNASKKYSVIINDNFDLFESLVSAFGGEKVAIITDENVNKIYGNCLDKYFKNKQIYHYELQSGEDSKCAGKYFEILNFLANNNFNRKDAIVAFGGGVTGDLTGFVASTFVRGITLIQVPTTLLSMVDSSVGGKTAINLDAGKNLVGTFYQPSLVYANVSLLKTLPQREINSGLGEIIKYCFLSNDLTIDDIKENNIQNIVYKCIKIKRDIVERDEKEGGDRKLLNLGHTIGHAIEKASNFEISHGESVLKGLKFSLDISLKLGIISHEKYLLALEILKLSKCDIDCQYSKDELLAYMKNDKKSQGDKVDFIVVNDNLLSQMESIEYSRLYNLM